MSTTLIPSEVEEALIMVGRVAEKYLSVWKNRPASEQAALARYFLPHRSSKETLEPTRPRVIKWYCPFAYQHEFPTGHRYCINVYTGCGHCCIYCYVDGYHPCLTPKRKANFQRMIDLDMADLELFDVPPAPVHLSNSTDPFQPLEMESGDTRYALEQILAHRNRFTTVTILTKSPLTAVQTGCAGLLRSLRDLPSSHPRAAEFTARRLPGVCVEVSLAFWREEARQFYDPMAPSVQDRIQGLRELTQMQIPVVLRIDPLFPRSPLTEHPVTNMADLGLCEAQTLDDLRNLVALAKELGARHVVYSPVKVVKPRGCKLCGPMQAMRRAYELLAQPQKLVFHSGSWRLPREVAQHHIVEPFLEICQDLGVHAKFCMQNLIETP